MSSAVGVLLLILSPRSYNSKARLAIACPITSHVKGYPFEVSLPPGARFQGLSSPITSRTSIGKRGDSRSRRRLQPTSLPTCASGSVCCSGCSTLTFGSVPDGTVT